MFFAMIGWLFLAAVMVFITIVYVAISWDSLSTYTIGGVPNSLLKQGSVLLTGFVLAGLWYTLFTFAPFTFTMTAGG